MNRIEHLLTIAAEEGSEVAQRCTKALRFSLDEVQPGQELNNYERIWEEFAQLHAMMDMLREAKGEKSVPVQFWAWAEGKKIKVEQYLRYSAECGTLDSSVDDCQGGKKC